MTSLDTQQSAQGDMPQRQESYDVPHLPGEVLATMSHELLTPLAVIKGYATTLLRHERHLSREERRTYLEAIDHASDQLEAAVNLLLHTSQAVHGDLMLQRQPVTVVDLIREALELRAEQVGQLGFDHRVITFTYDEQLAQADVLADIPRLLEVICHVIDNAVKYSSTGLPVSISVQYDDSNDTAVMRIRDEGIGIAPEYHARIFEPFFRVNDSLTREEGGLGLGLAYCRSVIQLHGGTIWCESMLGHGSVFAIRLPLMHRSLNV
jgi:signal transduction histidine kinase